MGGRGRKAEAKMEAGEREKKSRAGRGAKVEKVDTMKSRQKTERKAESE